MGKKNKPEVAARRQAMIGNVLAVCVEPGTKIFDMAEQLLGIVEDRKPVVNHPAKTVYLSTNDYEAAKRALPPAQHVLPGLPGGRNRRTIN